MTLYAYELNSVMAGMLAVLIPVVVAFAWLLQREQRKTAHVDWLLAEINAMRAELHRHGIKFVSVNPSNIAHVPFAQAFPVGPHIQPEPDGGAVKAEQSLKEYMEPSDLEKQAYREWDAWEDELAAKLGKCETEDQIDAVWDEMTAKSGVLVRRYLDVPLPVARMWGQKWREGGE